MDRLPDGYIPVLEDGYSHQHTVLYIEDDRPNIFLIEKIIERRVDLKLLTATNGKVGAQMARDNHPDVIVLDINLPDINGIELFRILQDSTQTMNIPVVALSSDAYPRQIQRGLDVGFFSYLTKPFQIPDFLGTLDSALLFSARVQRLVLMNSTQ